MIQTRIAIGVALVSVILASAFLTVVGKTEVHSCGWNSNGAPDSRCAVATMMLNHVGGERR